MQIRKAVQAIAQAKRPILCCGGGVVLAGAREELIAFAKKSGIPVCATMMGIGVVPMDSPHYLGMIGMHGRTSANRSMKEADLVVLVRRPRGRPGRLRPAADRREGPRDPHRH